MQYEHDTDTDIITALLIITKGIRKGNTHLTWLYPKRILKGIVSYITLEP